MRIFNDRELHWLRFELLERDSYQVFRRHGDPRIQSILDIGANIGMFSMLCHFLLPKARIIALEPDAQIFEMLKDNTAQMLVEPHWLALSDGSPVGIVQTKAESSHATYYDTTSAGAVPGQTLASIVANCKLDPSTLFLKVDCEGAERHLYRDKASEAILRQTVAGGIEWHQHRRQPAQPTIAQYRIWLDEVLHDTHRVDYERRFGHISRWERI